MDPSPTPTSHSTTVVRPPPARVESPEAFAERLWQRDRMDFLMRVEVARSDVGSALRDTTPAASTSLLLAMLLFLGAYLLRPTPAILLPGRGAFGVPAKRRRKG